MNYIKRKEFGGFLLNENQVYLGQRLSDVLNALQELNQNAKSMGARQLVRNSEEIVNNLRKILHTHWSKREERFLRPIQKVGVAIMRAIEEKDDLPTILSSATQELEKLTSKLGTPVNSIASPEEGQSQPKDTSQEQGIAPPPNLDSNPDSKQPVANSPQIQ